MSPFQPLEERKSRCNRRSELQWAAAIKRWLVKIKIRTLSDFMQGFGGGRTISRIGVTSSGVGEGGRLKREGDDCRLVE